MNSISLSDKELKLISELVYEKFGICLSQKKRNLIIGRLQRELLSGNFTKFMDYYHHVIQDRSGLALLTLVDRISTNHTYFFREKEHFDFFTARVLPCTARLLKKKGGRGIRIWCAGCSSGEEPYTLAMVIKEFSGKGASGMDTDILATDISVSVLEEAKAGAYTADKIARVPPLFRQKYFNCLKDGRWEVKESLKDMIVFRRLNLIRREYPFKGLFDVIFCRNVMIYFDKATRHALIERFHRYTEAGGYLFVGHSETFGRSNDLYRFVIPSVYQKI